MMVKGEEHAEGDEGVRLWRKKHGVYLITPTSPCLCIANSSQAHPWSNTLPEKSLRKQRGTTVGWGLRQ